MKRSLAQTLSLLAGAALFQAASLAAAETTPVLLRYAFGPGQTNAYTLQIEAQGETGREAVAGTFVVSARTLATNLISLSWRGQLHPKTLGGMPPMMGYRPGSVMPLSSLAYGPQNEPKELVIDERGQIVRQAGDVALPIPLGQLIVSLIQPLPAEATAGWQTEQDVFVLDEPLLQGPATAFLNPPGGFNYGGYYPGRPAQGVLAARQKTKIKVLEVTPATVTLQKTLALDSRMLTGLEPRVSATGEGKIVFARAGGLPQQVRAGVQGRRCHRESQPPLRSHAALALAGGRGAREGHRPTASAGTRNPIQAGGNSEAGGEAEVGRPGQPPVRRARVEQQPVGRAHPGVAYRHGLTRERPG